MNKVIRVKRRIPEDVCKKILEAWNIFEMNWTREIELYFNEIIAQERSAAHTQTGKERQQKTRAQYEKIPSDNYPQKFPNFIITDNIETNVPLLTNEDIAFSYDAGRGWTKLTHNTKVPTFDIRRNIDNFIERNGEIKPDGYYLEWKKIHSGKQICVYNEADDVSHIICFHNDRWLSWAVNIWIKGKVSQQDARNLLNYLQKNNILEINPLNWKISENTIQNLNATTIQNAIIKYFNEKNN